MTLPNILTFFRILLLPAVLWGLASHHFMVAFLLFVFSALTDWLDGFLARTLNQTSRWGAFLDPVADKLLVAGTLVVLSVNYAHNPAVWVAAVIMISRDMVMASLRDWMSQQGLMDAVKVSWWGKWKTAVQMIAMAGLILMQVYPWLATLRLVTLGTLWIAVLLSVWSLILYFVAALKAAQAISLKKEK